jgi:ribosomal protein L5
MTAFPELSLDIIKVNFGIEITFVTNTNSKEKSIKLFEELGFPLKPIIAKK